MRPHLFIIYLSVFFTLFSQSVQAEEPEYWLKHSFWKNCIGYYPLDFDIEEDAALLGYEPNYDAPIDKDFETDCPAPEKLIETNCPAVWPKDNKTPFSRGFSYSTHSNDHDSHSIRRQKFDFWPTSTQLLCEYRGGDAQSLIFEVPSPVIKCGWKDDKSEVFGCSSLKPFGPLPKPIMYYPEVISPTTTLGGVGLNWTAQQLKDHAQQQGYAFVGTKDNLRFGLYGDNMALDVILNPKTRRSQEVILFSSGNNLHRRAVRQFGFSWWFDPDITPTLMGGTKKEFWESTDEKIRIIFQPEVWPEAGRNKPSTLRLLFWNK
ncbi:MAG: hypothetical protein COB59_11695 [Rhodospirillaceae bacterium]|nr:MAG: hypothetical protein COB59_11695 [Rhodospirillaceae bacterium]